MWREVVRSLFAPVLSETTYLPEEVRGVLLCELLEEVFGGAGGFKEIGIMCKLLSVLSNKEPEPGVIKLKEYTQAQVRQTLFSTIDSIQIIQPCSVVERYSDFGRHDSDHSYMRREDRSRILADISMSQSQQASSANLLNSQVEVGQKLRTEKQFDLSTEQRKVLNTLERCESRLKMEMTTVFTTLKTHCTLQAMEQLASSRLSSSSQPDDLYLKHQPPKSKPNTIHSSSPSQGSRARRNSRSGADSSRLGLSQADISAIEPLDRSGCTDQVRPTQSTPLTDEIEEFLKHEAETQQLLAKLAASHNSLLRDDKETLDRSLITRPGPDSKKRPNSKGPSEPVSISLPNQELRKNDKRTFTK